MNAQLHALICSASVDHKIILDYGICSASLPWLALIDYETQTILFPINVIQMSTFTLENLSATLQVKIFIHYIVAQHSMLAANYIKVKG